MGCTVKDLSNRLDSRELTEWMVYYSLEPWGSNVEGYRDALTCATVANAGLFASAPSLLKKKQFHPKDFLITASRSKPSQSWVAQKAIAKNIISVSKAGCSGGCNVKKK